MLFNASKWFGGFDSKKKKWLVLPFQAQSKNFGYGKTELGGVWFGIGNENEYFVFIYIF